MSRDDEEREALLLEVESIVQAYLDAPEDSKRADPWHALSEIADVLCLRRANTLYIRAECPACAKPNDADHLEQMGKDLYVMLDRIQGRDLLEIAFGNAASRAIDSLREAQGYLLILERRRRTSSDER